MVKAIAEEQVLKPSFRGLFWNGGNHFVSSLFRPYLDIYSHIPPPSSPFKIKQARNLKVKKNKRVLQYTKTPPEPNQQTI
jgi:hypothetical protein